MNIDRPKYKTVPLADGLRWRGGGGFIYERKYDGCWDTETIGDSIFIREKMRDGNHVTFDIVQHHGQDIRQLSLRERLHILNTEYAGQFLRPAVGSGGEFLQAVLANGFEGVVAKYLDDPFGAMWYRCKRAITLDLLVVDKIVPSIRLRTITGEDRGWCQARAAFDAVMVGDIVEVECFSLTKTGKMREPRFKRPRPDKAAAQ